MSDEEVTVETSDGQILAAEYKDGQLQIVEVTAFDKNDEETQIIPELSDSGVNMDGKYMEILDGGGKGVMHLDLLNLTLVRCQDDEVSYQLVTEGESTEGDMQSDTVTCVLQANEAEDQDDQGSYVMVDGGEGDGLSWIIKSLQPASSPPKPKPETSKTPLTPAEILEKAKALQKAKAALASMQASRGRTRKRKNDLPPPHELLASPNFKLYLYSCKMCSFKCNAIKDMWAHKASEHAGGARRGAKGTPATLQCARCPFRAAMHSQLLKHTQDRHQGQQTFIKYSNKTNQFSERVQLDTAEVAAADVLVCGACGFETPLRMVFKKHIEEKHNATASC